MNKENKKNFDWNERKISQFIIWDLVSILQKNESGDLLDAFILDYRNAAQKHDKYKFVIDFLDELYNNLIHKLFVKRNENNKKILFHCGSKYPSIILKANKHYAVKTTANGKSDRLFALENFIGYVNTADLNRFIYNYLTQKDDKNLYELLNRVEKKIKSIGPDCIVLSNDFLPIERAIVLVSKKIGIPTIVIQHGIFQSVSQFADGKVADYIFAWGQYFKDLYIKKSMKEPRDVYILGYPQLIEKNKEQRIVKDYYTIYYLGSNFEKYNKKLLSIKLKTIRGINRICAKIGMKFIYRFHPGDDRKLLKTKLPEVTFAPQKEKLTETFHRGDVFISFNSTSLVEAAIRSKVALQLMNFPRKTDNFEELGACNKSFQTIDELENYLTKIANSPNLDNFKSRLNNNYIELSYDPGKRFLEILDDISKKQ